METMLANHPTRSRRHGMLVAVVGAVLLEGAYGCVGEADFEDFVDENVGETSEALITGDWWNGSPGGPYCDSYPSSASVGISAVAAPWKAMSANGTWSVSGATGVRIEYYLSDEDDSDGNGNTTELLLRESDETNTTQWNHGQWSFSANLVTCRANAQKTRTFQICAIPKINNNMTTCWSKKVCLPAVAYDPCANAVGVIPENDATCGSTYDRISIRMSTESGLNYESGWNSAWGVSSSYADIYACRVDGTQYKPITTTADSSKYYAMLQLGAACPPGSVAFSKFIDNANPGSSNQSSGANISPNTSSSDTTLKFCLFRSGSSTMPAFPIRGYSYGVFAPSFFNGAFRLDGGEVRTDDENGGYVTVCEQQCTVKDATPENSAMAPPKEQCCYDTWEGNKNKCEGDATAMADAAPIISCDADTKFRFAKVR